jgi:hypothetical protein
MLGTAKSAREGWDSTSHGKEKAWDEIRIL